MRMVGCSTASGLEAFLDIFSGEDPPFPHWLSGDGPNVAVPSYCRPCAVKAVAAGLAELVDGGWEPEESGGPVNCESCGRLLAYRLANFGVGQELDHFRGRFARSHAPVWPLEAYEIARMVEAAPNDSEVLSIAESAAQSILRRQS